MPPPTLNSEEPHMPRPQPTAVGWGLGSDVSRAITARTAIRSSQFP